MHPNGRYVLEEVEKVLDRWIVIIRINDTSIKIITQKEISKSSLGPIICLAKSY